jgi:hypothetical protein
LSKWNRILVTFRRKRIGQPPNACKDDTANFCDV